MHTRRRPTRIQILPTHREHSGELQGALKANMGYPEAFVNRSQKLALPPDIIVVPVCPKCHGANCREGKRLMNVAHFVNQQFIPTVFIRFDHTSGRPEPQYNGISVAGVVDHGSRNDRLITFLEKFKHP